MKNKKTAAILLAFALAFSSAGCGAASGQNRDASDSDALAETHSSAIGTGVENSSDEDAIAELFSKRDLSGDYTDCVNVTLDGSSAKADGTGVEIGDGLVTITAAGTYLLTGSFDGRVEIRSGDKDKVQLVLSGASIVSDGASAICALSADKLFLTLAEGTENRISASGELSELDGVGADGAIFAKCDLTVNGTGSLSVTCESGHGLVSKDDLKIAAASLTLEAAKQGLSGKDSVSIASGTVTIASEGDGIHSENTDKEGKGSVNILGGTLLIESGDDGVHAEETLTVSGGSVTLSRCYEGLEAADIVISGGEIDILASDDGLNAAGGADNSGWGGFFGRGDDPFAAQDVSITISGGTLRINAGGDGIDSNGDLTVSGGTILISGPTNGGNGAIDYNGSGVITGGTLVAAGASGMAENFDSSSTQPCMLVTFNGTVAGGSEISVADASGRELVSFTPEKNYQCAVISAPALKVGESYTVTAGGQSQSVSFSSVIYGSGSGMGGFGGGPGGMGGFGGNPGAQGGWSGGNDNMGGFGQMPGGMGGLPADLPEDFSPADLPEDFDPADLPEGFDGGMTPPDGSGDGQTPPGGFGGWGGQGGQGGQDGRPGGGRRP
ncbi:MAG: carbohydrate-binding domain-containing protein [Oscillospiraceae bacterium]|nr:carbohydrate-binding domain-containing protein [Oscillospiraceae bacterium]